MTEVRDNDRGANGFGTPNYVIYDVGDINNPTFISKAIIIQAMLVGL